MTIIQSGNEPAFEVMIWGLIPSWSREPAGLINARAETLEEKPSFSESFARRRCLILADGFYEWRRNGKTKASVLFSNEGRSAFRICRLVGSLAEARR